MTIKMALKRWCIGGGGGGVAVLNQTDCGADTTAKSLFIYLFGPMCQLVQLVFFKARVTMRKN